MDKLIDCKHDENYSSVEGSPLTITASQQCATDEKRQNTDGESAV